MNTMNEAQTIKMEKLDAEFTAKGLTEEDLTDAAQNAQDLCFDEHQTDNHDLWLKYYESSLYAIADEK